MSRLRSAPPRLHKNSQTRSLSFDSDLLQSSMRLDAPDELLLEYTRAMMGFLLFLPNPVSILMIGLGGGSLPKYCHRHLPHTRVTVVEIEQDVIDLRQEFDLPDDDERLQVICADGGRFVSLAPERYDVILVDGFNAEGQAPELCTPAFYRHCGRALAPQGLLVANLHAKQPALATLLLRLGKAFDATFSITVEGGDNEVAFAGPPSVFLEGRDQFSSRWQALPAPHQATLGACSTRIERALGKIGRHPPVSERN